MISEVYSSIGRRYFSKNRNYRTEPFYNFLDAKEKPFLNPSYVIQ